MPSKTLEDKVDDLAQMVAALAQKIENLEGGFNGLVAMRGELAREVAVLGRSLAVLEQQVKDLRGWKDGFGSVDQLKIDLAILCKELDEMRKWQDEVKKQKDEWGKRAWTLFSSIIIALMSLTAGYYLRSKQ